VEKRGTFNDDAFFKDSWQEWDKAMKEVVDKWDKEHGTNEVATLQAPGAETKTVYRNIRSSNVSSEDSQAVSCIEEDGKYKMVIDVKEFKPEAINVKTVDDTVIVEGKVEKKEGNSISTQMFTRRFLLPSSVDFNQISSALSKDGVLTINAPKLANYQAIQNSNAPVRNSAPMTIRNSAPMPQFNITTSTQQSPNGVTSNGSTTRTYTSKVMGGLNSSPATGKPTMKSDPSTMPAAGMPTNKEAQVPGSSHLQTNQDHMSSTLIPHQPFNTTSISPLVEQHSREHWSTFNQMVEKSQREMEDMMRRTSLEPSMATMSITPALPVATVNTVVSPPPGVVTTRDQTTKGNTLTDRQEQKWADQPAPGVQRQNRNLKEEHTIKAPDGSVIGKGHKMQHESRAEGGNEEILPDGSKRTTFSKSYESKSSYSTRSGDRKLF